MQEKNEIVVESKPMNEREYIKSERVSWDTFFMKIVDDCSAQSTCLLKHVGAVLVKGRRILSAGYAGPPKGIPHCKKCIRKEKETKSYSECPSVHAEINCLIQCAMFGVSPKDSTIYVEYIPCFSCTASLINAGISKIVFREAPVDDIAIQLAINAGIELCIYKDGKIKIVDVKIEKLPWE